MAGPWPCAPCCDLNIIYTSCTILIPWGQNWGVAFPSPFIINVSVLYKIEQNWMCQSHGILQLPRSLIRTVVIPLHLYLSNGSILEHCDLLVEDAQWLDLELSFGFHLDHIPIYHMVRIMYIFLKQGNMKNIMSFSASRKCNSICHWPYYFNHF